MVNFEILVVAAEIMVLQGARVMHLGSWDFVLK